MTEVPLDYLKAHVPDEYERRIAIIKQGMQAATARSVAKKRMLERLAVKRKRFDLADRFDI